MSFCLFEQPERPVYSTPHPVQSTPANNECKLVELRGADVASFIIGDEEYICLPQVLLSNYSIDLNAVLFQRLV